MTRSLPRFSLPSRVHWRHALLALEQARTGVNVYRQFLEIEDVSIEGEGLRLLSALRLHPSPEDDAWFDTAYTETAPLGVNYMAVGFLTHDIIWERGHSELGLDVRAELERGNLRFLAVHLQLVTFCSNYVKSVDRTKEDDDEDMPNLSLRTHGQERLDIDGESQASMQRLWASIHR